jgi:putative redox protein
MKPFSRHRDERDQRMKAISRRRDGAVRNEIEVRGHRLVADEQEGVGGEDEGPSPLELLAASLASCTAITMQMYAENKGWDIGDVSVGVDYAPAHKGAPTSFEMIIDLPKELPEDQRTRLLQIAAKCPVHRTLEGEVMFKEHVRVV